MADSTISPNMGLVVPTVSVDPGPDWANNLNASLGIIDQHNHSPGQGVFITPSGLDINADLPINLNNLTVVKTVNFSPLLVTLPGASPNLGCIYVAGNELIYNDESGNVVPITKTGSVNSGAGSITGLPSGTASASYSGGSQTFVWQSATNTPANMDFGSAILRNIVANSKGLTLNPPNAMGADFSLTLPSLPGLTSLVTLDPAGNFGTTMTNALADSVAVDITSTGADSIASFVTVVGADDIALSMDATGADFIANTRTRTTGTTVAAGGIGVATPYTAGGTTNGPVLNQVVITTTGRPIMLMMQTIPSNTSTGSATVNTAGAGTSDFVLEIYRDNGGGPVIIARNIWTSDITSKSFCMMLGFMSYIDVDIIGLPTTYTYYLNQLTTAGTTVDWSNASLVVYEL